VSNLQTKSYSSTQDGSPVRSAASKRIRLRPWPNGLLAPAGQGRRCIAGAQAKLTTRARSHSTLDAEFAVQRIAHSPEAAPQPTTKYGGGQDDPNHDEQNPTRLLLSISLAASLVASQLESTTRCWLPSLNRAHNQ
jgi:hypothetical protein